MLRRFTMLCITAWLMLPAPVAAAGPSLRLEMGEGQPAQVGMALKMVLVLTVLAVAPALLLTTTSFVRIAVVLSLLRNALGTQNLPPNQVLMGLALFMTVAIMAPVGTDMYEHAVQPYLDGTLQAGAAFDTGAKPLRKFMLRQTRPNDLALFYDLGKTARPEDSDSVKMHLLAPAFLISELRTAFEMGFLIYMPFLLIDIIVASVLMSMGMVMLPPAMIGLPIKLMLFVLADGWNVLVASLVRSFA